MKKVIFVCLLTFSVCLSQPANTGNPSPAPEAHETTKSNVTEAATTTAPVAPTATAAPTINGTTSNDTKPATTTAAPVTEAGKNNTTADKTTSTTTAAPTTTTTATPKPPTTTSTAAPVPDKSTQKPADTTPAPTLQARGFDGASFIGGIILTLGLLAIGFMGFKYYKAQTERNYHTL